MSTKTPRRIFVALLTGAAVFVLGGAATAETLADAMVSAYKNSNLLDQNRAVLRAADEDVASAVASLRPVLNFVANSDYSKAQQQSSLTGLYSTREGTETTFALAAEMVLLDSGRSKLGIDIAKETVLATREALVGVEQNVLLGAVSAFMNVRSTSEYVTLNRNSVRVIGEELRAAQDRFDVGEVTRTDVAQAEAALAGVRATLAAAEGDLQISREAYKAATGHYPGALSAPPKAPALPRSLDEAKSIAQRTHPAIKQSQREVTAAELGVALAIAQRGSTLTGSAQFARDDDGRDATGVGLSFRQPLYQGGALSAAHRRAIASRDAARSGLHQTGVEVTQAVGEAWANLAVARAQITAIDRQIRAATEAYRGVREEATLGARTTLDVLDAEQELLDAQANRISAEASLQVAVYSLLSSMGLLTAEHLNLGIPTYDPSAYYNAVSKAPVTSIQGKSLDRVLRSIGND